MRTSLTAFAGSIGIIGIILVLAFSQGVSLYVRNMEESSLSMYPISIEQTQLNLMSIMSKLTDSMNNDREEYPSEDAIYTNKVIGGIFSDWRSLTAQNDLVTFKEYLDENFDENLGYVKYNYGVTLNVYAQDFKSTDTYMKVEPFTDVMETAMAAMNLGTKANSLIDMMKMYAPNISSWSEMMSNRELMKTQYDLIGKSRWPAQEVYQDENGDWVTEVVIVADEKNQINDYTLFMLGLLSEKDLGAIISGSMDISSNTYTSDDLIGHEYYILAKSDYFEYDEENARWIQHPSNEQSAEFVNNNFCVKAKVTGVIRPSKSSAGGALFAAIGYDASLTDFLIDHIDNSEIVTQSKIQYTDEKTGQTYWKNLVKGTRVLGTEDYTKMMEEFGVADKTKPNAISIYANSFESKEKIIKFIENYNENAEEGKEIKYSDSLSGLMGFINRLSDVISKVLIGFTSVSLIVSSIMIAVIIYTSVLERRKEVGILRSIGARKGDIVMIFMAESGMLGLFAGLLGAFIAWIITLPVNAVLATAVGIAGLATITWGHVGTMVAVSFLLSVFAGVVPAFAGANQDPAVALRTE